MSAFAPFHCAVWGSENEVTAPSGIPPAKIGAGFGAPPRHNPLNRGGEEIYPSAMASNVWTEIAGISDEQSLKMWERTRPMAPQRFADRVLRAVARGDAISVVPAWWKAFWYLERLSPALSMRLAKETLNRVREMDSGTS